MKGTYVLLLKLEAPRKIRAGSLGLMEFRKGYYAYVGSGMGSLEKRIERHLRRKKRKFWHIDYLLAKGKVKKVLFWDSEKVECELAKGLAERFEGVSKFGSSDCKCKSHLFYSENPLEKIVLKIIRSLQGPRSPLHILKSGIS
jgi:Uri superfamily endonuclease